MTLRVSLFLMGKRNGTGAGGLRLGQRFLPPGRAAQRWARADESASAWQEPGGQVLLSQKKCDLSLWPGPKVLFKWHPFQELCWSLKGCGLHHVSPSASGPPPPSWKPQEAEEEEAGWSCHLSLSFSPTKWNNRLQVPVRTK